jgi:hypothetical protein
VLINGACVCAPGYYTPFVSRPLNCIVCGEDKYCPGNSSIPNDRQTCPIGTGTPDGLETADSASDCVKLTCNPCPSATPPVYFTRSGDNKGIYYQPAWNPAAAPQVTAQSVCNFSLTDPLFSGGGAAINDIAVTNAGQLLIAGRTNTGTSPGYLLLVVPELQTAGQPCIYSKLLTTPFVIAGLGASSSSDLFLGTGDNSIFTYRIVSDPVTGVVTATVVGSIVSGLGGGAGDITLAPGRTDLGKKFLVSSGEWYLIIFAILKQPTLSTLGQPILCSSIRWAIQSPAASKW